MKTGATLRAWAFARANELDLVLLPGSHEYLSAVIATVYLTGANDAIQEEIAYHLLHRKEQADAETHRDHRRG